ncbi:hypothetical protein BV898_18673 [Hypsibius exemplaris]|uniref:Uncharacterized protein n=1 Tax=Hypsibius exemplaris TaxID=2072580 RepID=A0A9X6NKE3_HYPEX|nr:hypothetical protein BV898_18673 [Hypsibius exemplaris]
MAEDYDGRNVADVMAEDEVVNVAQKLHDGRSPVRADHAGDRTMAEGGDDYYEDYYYENNAGRTNGQQPR